MTIAVDVCVGNMGIAILRGAGHRVLTADHGESDRSWFARALKAGAQLIVAADADLEILAYDHNVNFFKVRSGERGHKTAERILRRFGGAA